MNEYDVEATFTLGCVEPRRSRVLYQHVVRVSRHESSH